MPPIAYRGFVIAPITLRALSTILARSPVPPSPKTSLLEGGGPPAGGGRSLRASRPYHPSLPLNDTRSFSRTLSPKTSLLERGGPPAGGGRSSRASRPYHPSSTLSKSLIQPRVQGRNPGRFNGGYGVPRGFKGEKSKFPPNPLGPAERVPA